MGTCLGQSGDPLALTPGTGAGGTAREPRQPIGSLSPSRNPDPRTHGGHLAPQPRDRKAGRAPAPGTARRAPAAGGARRSSSEGQGTETASQTQSQRRRHKSCRCEAPGSAPSPAQLCRPVQPSGPNESLIYGCFSRVPASSSWGRGVPKPCVATEARGWDRAHRPSVRPGEGPGRGAAGGTRRRQLRAAATTLSPPPRLEGPRGLQSRGAGLGGGTRCAHPASTDCEGRRRAGSPGA